MANFIAKWVDYKDPTAEINQLKADVADLQEKYNNLPTEVGDVGTMKADITTLKGKFNATKAGQYMESTDAAGNVEWKDVNFADKDEFNQYKTIQEGISAALTPTKANVYFGSTASGDSFNAEWKDITFAEKADLTTLGDTVDGITSRLKATAAGMYAESTDTEGGIVWKSIENNLCLRSDYDKLKTGTISDDANSLATKLAAAEAKITDLTSRLQALETLLTPTKAGMFIISEEVTEG